MAAYQGDSDSVQVVLWEIWLSHPELVGYIPETKRLYLVHPQRDMLPVPFHTKLQDAFFHDVGELCHFYGLRYLADWRAIASKSARETFWGTSYLCNRTFNYFGIWKQNKPWICEVFGFCQTEVRNDPVQTEFASFPNFEASLWMFIHTIYSYHYLERLPDGGARIEAAIAYERQNGVRYWLPNAFGQVYADQLPGEDYPYEALIYSWSEHEINNLCENCSRDSDREWILQVRLAADRARIRG